MNIEQMPLPQLPMLSPAVHVLVWVMILCGLVALPTLMRLWRQFIRSMGKSVETLSCGERTLGERISQFVAMVISSAGWGIILVSAFLPLRPVHVMTPAQGIAVTGCAMLVAQAMQYVGYMLTGYAFTSWPNTRQWLHALTVTQSMTAYAIILPALVALLYPSVAMSMAIVSLVLFLLFRILLWIRGFQIFYESVFSGFHFFLYLCTLETAPLLLPLATALFLS